jgi:hypothetical protein
MVMLVAGGLSSCEQLSTNLASSCHDIETSIRQKGITWENAKSQASIDQVVVECLPLKDASNYKIVATAKVTTTIDDVLFPLYGPLTDAIRFEALSEKGAVIAGGDVSYKVPRLQRAENVSMTFRDLSASEVSRITKIVVGWSFQ